MRRRSDKQTALADIECAFGNDGENDPMGGLIMETRYARRGCSRHTDFVAVAIGLLTLIVGLNTAIFSLVDHVLLKPRLVKNSDGLVTNNLEQRDFSYLIFDQLRLRTGSISSLPFVFPDGVTRVEMVNAKSRTQTQPVRNALASREYFRSWRAKTITSHKRTSEDDQAEAAGVAEPGYECPLSRDKLVISQPEAPKQKLLIIGSLTPGELFGKGFERPDDVRERFVRIPDCPDEGKTCGLPQEDRSTIDSAVRNKICVPLVGKKVEAEDEDPGTDSGQTPTPPPERAQEREL